MYWINAKTNPPQNNQRLIGLDRYYRVHPMIFRDGAYFFYGPRPYYANPLAYPLWWIPMPEFEDGHDHWEDFAITR